MRSGVICVLFVLFIRREGSGAEDDEFRPTPIPLNEWREVRGWRGQRAGTLHEVLHAPPAPYWEDALRHSVYLTLVRDKIDQLIAKGDYVDRPANDLDDRDLWDKVKRAPFDRADDESAPFGDVAVMAKGKLMEENGGFRFTEDDKFKDKCAHDKCMEGVKALWSVKRVRQRDSDASGRYHYEVTFSVVTQKKHKKHDKPARTFTVRETSPEKIMETPQEHRYYEPTAAPVPVPVPVQAPRTERALWFHKNITPSARNQARQHHNGLDRLFSSLFSDDDEDDIPPPRYKPKQYYPPPPVYQQYSKAGYVGAPSEQQQKKLIPHSHKPHHVYKYNQYGRPIPPPPQQPPHVHHHYLDIEQIGVVSNPYQDHRYGPPIKPGKTARPPVLPTPPSPILPTKNYTIETTTQLKPNESEDITSTPKPEIVHPPKTYNKHKPTTVKISYVTDHVRPPVYNAPPGVFVTMDKKPFKPMPPLRLVHSSKLHKPPRPTDFRPSPQVLDIQFSEPDPLFDTAFRPITVSYGNSNTTDKSVTAASENNFRKSNTTAKKPPKKNEIVKAQRVTTTAPEIITAHTVDEEEEEDSEAEWTNVLGAFAKTTPMAAEKEKPKTTETTTPLATSTASTTTTTTTVSPAPSTTLRKRTTTTTEAPTTPKPKKRTRPPPKFTKPEKVKKHKRITTTTTTTTESPHKRKKEQDLTPQASSASATTQLPSSTTPTTATTTTTTTTTTTPQPTTTTTQSTTKTTQATTTTTEQSPTSPPETETTKRRNRYRQSTLKYRSTSVNDKKEEKARTILPPTGKFPARRKGAKYQNDISSTPKFSDMTFDEDGQEEHVVSPYKSKSISTTESLLSSTPKAPTTPAYEEVADHIYITSESPDYSMAQEDDFDDNLDEEEQESRDNSEYLPATSALVTPSETTNEIVEIEDEPEEIAAEIIVTTTPSAPKNKTKCKKKKLHNLTNTTEETKPEETKSESTIQQVIPLETSSTSTTTTTTTESSTPDIFQEIFGGFTFDDSIAESLSNESSSNSELEEQETTNQEKYMKSEDDFADFFEALEDKHRQDHRDAKFDDQYEYDDKDSLDDDESLFQNEDDRRSSRDTQDEEDSYDDYHERPYSLLELMAME